MLKQTWLVPTVISAVLVAGCGGSTGTQPRADDVPEAPSSGASDAVPGAPGSGPSDAASTSPSVPDVSNAALPRKELTPGAVVPGLTQEQVCAKDFPGTAPQLTPATRTEVYESYGVTTREKQSAVRPDRLIGAGLGGDASAANHWPQPAADVENKNRLESILRRMVCTSKLPLGTAQAALADDWKVAFNTYVTR